MSKSTKKAPAPKKAVKKTRKKTPKQPPNAAFTAKVASKPTTDPYSSRGRKPLYNTPEEMESAIEAYFTYIQGEKGEREEEIFDPKNKKIKKELVEYWIRRPEPPTRTGLVLYLGFSSHSALQNYANRDIDFKAVTTRGMMRVEHGYEKDLRDRDATRGAQFALSNMGWKNKQDVQALDKEGNPADPTPAAQINVTSIADNAGKV